MPDALHDALERFTIAQARLIVAGSRAPMDARYAAAIVDRDRAARQLLALVDQDDPPGGSRQADGTKPWPVCSDGSNWPEPL
jgi:hypothetical protein